MSLVTDQEYLKEDQYKTAANLEARVNIHRLFSTNPYGWFRWEFEHLAVQPGERVLDLGCGPGELWKAQAARLPEGARLVLCDLSTGMVGAARLADGRFVFAAADAQSIPFEANSFDLVTANHMLYHVPDIDRALRDIRRVLRPGGRLAAATNGELNMRQLHDLISKVVPDYQPAGSSAGRFSLENGPAMVRAVFEDVRVELYEDGLFVTDPQPLVDYVGSMWGVGRLDEPMRAKLNELISQEIERYGGLRIDKSAGMVLAVKAA